MLVATANFWQSPRRARRQTRSASLGGRSPNEGSTTSWRDLAQQLARPFRTLPERSARRRCLRHHRSRLFAFGGGDHKLGERPVCDCRSCLGFAEIAHHLPRRRRRHLRCIFRTVLCPLETAVRVGLRSPETRTPERGRNSKDQFCGFGKTLASVDVVGKALRSSTSKDGKRRGCPTIH